MILNCICFLIPVNLVGQILRPKHNFGRNPFLNFPDENESSIDEESVTGHSSENLCPSESHQETHSTSDFNIFPSPCSVSGITTTVVQRSPLVHWERYPTSVSDIIDSVDLHTRSYRNNESSNTCSEGSFWSSGM